MKGTIQRTAVEYTYVFNIDITTKLNNHHYPNFHPGLETLLSDLDVELVNVTNHFLIFTIDIDRLGSDVDVKPIAHSVRDAIEEYIEDFFT